MAEKGVDSVPGDNPIDTLVNEGYLNTNPKTSSNGNFTLSTSNGKATVTADGTQYYPAQASTQSTGK